jgi:hypothetical protein
MTKHLLNYDSFVKTTLKLENTLFKAHQDDSVNNEHAIESPQLLPQ